MKKPILLIAPADTVPSPDEYVEFPPPGVDIDKDGLVAYLYALKGDRRRLAARARDLAVTLTPNERKHLAHLAETYTDPPRPKAGKPETPESKMLAIASMYIKVHVWEQQPHKEALFRTAKRFGLKPNSVEKSYLNPARLHEQGTWWRRVCELAAKHKRWPELESIPE